LFAARFAVVTVITPVGRNIKANLPVLRKKRDPTLQLALGDLQAPVECGLFLLIRLFLSSRAAVIAENLFLANSSLYFRNAW